MRPGQRWEGERERARRGGACGASWRAGWARRRAQGRQRVFQQECHRQGRPNHQGPGCLSPGRRGCRAGPGAGGRGGHCPRRPGGPGRAPEGSTVLALHHFFLPAEINNKRGVFTVHLWIPWSCLLTPTGLRFGQSEVQPFCPLTPLSCTPSDVGSSDRAYCAVPGTPSLHASDQTRSRL